MEAAAESFTKVVQMAPQHLEARLSLATLQQQLGRMDCALKALESMYDSETLAQDSAVAQKARTLLIVTRSKGAACVNVCLFVGAEAAAASLHAAEDSGKNPRLPGRHDHHDLHAAEGDAVVACGGDACGDV